jgi:hypothetical protein
MEQSARFEVLSPAVGEQVLHVSEGSQREGQQNCGNSECGLSIRKRMDPWILHLQSPIDHYCVPTSASTQTGVTM